MKLFPNHLRIVETEKKYKKKKYQKLKEIIFIFVTLFNNFNLIEYYFGFVQRYFQFDWCFYFIIFIYKNNTMSSQDDTADRPQQTK